jgi:hypothetical protein
VTIQPVGQMATSATASVSQTEVHPAVESAPRPLKFSFTPKGGAAVFMGLQGFQITPRYSLGGNLSLEFNEYVALEAGYSYNESSVGIGSSNPWVNYINQFTSMYDPNMATYLYRQHVADLSAKIFVLGAKYRVRPFVTAGLGYARGMMNYDRDILALMQQAGLGVYAASYQTDSLLGQVGGGVDIVLSKNVSLGASFKYNHALASRENAPLYGPAFGGYGAGYTYGGMSPYGYSGYNTGVAYQNAAAMATDPNKAFSGGSLARTGFFSIYGSITITF